jgi:shikimate dehydrogenase
MKLFGLIGYPLSHSLSQEYFRLKFENEKIKDCEYRIFPMEHLDGFQHLISVYPELMGLNVTIPFKKRIIPYLNACDPVAKDIGAVNCIKIDRSSGKPFLTGYNTDIYGFENSLKPLLRPEYKKALILGTGGSANAVAFVLKSMGIEFYFVSRTPAGINQIGYASLTQRIINDHLIIINATPVGMFPSTGNCPDIPFKWISSEHLLFDLIYNPTETVFLKRGKDHGATTINGLQMLYLQADKSWEIWKQ